MNFIEEIHIGLLTAAAFSVLMTIGMAVIRAIVGPILFDRVLALNVIGTKIILLIAILGFLTGRPYFLDIAIAYALINFLGIIALLHLFHYGPVINKKNYNNNNSKSKNK